MLGHITCKIFLYIQSYFGTNYASTDYYCLMFFFIALCQTISLNAQLNYFNNLETLLRQERGEKEANVLLDRAIYFFSIGGNDYFVPFASNSSMQFLQSYSKQDYVNMVIGNLTTVIMITVITLRCCMQYLKQDYSFRFKLVIIIF